MFEHHWRSRKVLIVDDEYVPRSLESVALEGTARYSATEAANGTDALTLLSEDTYDCVVVDADMPDMSGDELIRMIRNSREMRSMPIVLVLPETTVEGETAEQHPGASNVLIKPFDPWDLARLLDKLTGALLDEHHALSVEAILRGFPHPAMILDSEHHVILANGSFYKEAGTGVGECYIYCNVQLHDGGVAPAACPLDESVRTNRPVERNVSTVLGELRVSVYPLATAAGDGRPLYIHITQPVGEICP